jgi:tetratricopeptide (TPR) repeat protein
VRVDVQLIDADSGAHLWAEQFDTPRADMLQTQDEIVTRLAHALQFQLPEAEVARLKRTPAANPGAEDLALQCLAAVRKAPEAVTREAQAGFQLCDQALALDPDNVLALALSSIRFWQPVSHNLSPDPKGDLERGDELVSKVLTLDPTFAYGHVFRAEILRDQGRFEEANAEAERALDLDPTAVDAYAQLAFNDHELGQFEKSLENLDKAIRLSPHDPSLHYWYASKAGAHFALKQYEQAIEWARRAIAIDPTFLQSHPALIASLGWTGRQAEAHEAIQRYLALFPTGPRTIAAWKAFKAQKTNSDSAPRVLELWDRLIEGLRKAGLPEE